MALPRGGAHDLDAHAPEIFGAARTPRASSRPLPGGREHGGRGRRHARSSPATSGCYARGCGTRSSSGTRTARSGSRAACPTLDDIVFHAKLGTHGARGRAAAGARGRAAPARARRRASSERAALLAKADLVTGMVGEFPELQGVMGRYYALARGRERRRRRRDRASTTRRSGPERPLPDRRRSASPVALADKLDTPGRLLRGRREARPARRIRYALRRAALGVIRLILENEPAAAAAGGRSQQPLCGLRRASWRASTPMRRRGLMGFFADRLKVPLQRAGRAPRPDRGGVRARRRGRSGPAARPGRGAQRVSSTTDDGANLLTALQARANIVRIEEKRDGRSTTAIPTSGACWPGRGAGAVRRLDAVGETLPRGLGRRRFCRRHGGARALRRPVDAFLRAGHGQRRRNRICASTACCCCDADPLDALGAVADFTLIEDCASDDQRRPGSR